MIRSSNVSCKNKNFSCDVCLMNQWRCRKEGKTHLNFFFSFSFLFSPPCPSSHPPWTLIKAYEASEGHRRARLTGVMIRQSRSRKRQKEMEA
ncbi:hypothetical protein CSUI_008285 [Cystoisospora suis]|uniref:Uncharacterized protein n=1 Tax=Cystoisospora suis TaxID=483139 RepID=A0A2C6KN18_9APIC|nr:hypothetical protein CSUI_008285 [Cystoisospora suis]